MNTLIVIIAASYSIFQNRAQRFIAKKWAELGSNLRGERRIIRGKGIRIMMGKITETVDEN